MPTVVFKNLPGGVGEFKSVSFFTCVRSCVSDIKALEIGPDQVSVKPDPSPDDHLGIKITVEDFISKPERTEGVKKKLEEELKKLTNKFFPGQPLIRYELKEEEEKGVIA